MKPKIITWESIMMDRDELQQKLYRSNFSEQRYLDPFKTGSLRLVFPQHLHLLPLFLVVQHIHTLQLERLQLPYLAYLLHKLFELMRTQTDQTLKPIMPVLFVKINPHETIVHVQLQQFGKLLHHHIHVLFQLLEGTLVVGRTEVKFDQRAQQIVVHEPEIRKVVALGLLTLQSVLEKVVQQLIPLLVATCKLVQVSLRQLHNLLRNALLHFLRLRVLLLLELHRQTLLHAKRCLAVHLFELRPFRYPLTTVEKQKFALPELFLKEKLAGNEQLTHDYDVQKTVLLSETVTVLTHHLIQFEDLLFYTVGKRVVF